MAPNTSITIRQLGPMVAAMNRYAQQLYQPPKETIRGIEPGTWFSPLQPVAPFAPPGTSPRGIQYLAGQNLTWTPRFDAEYSAARLKELARYPLAAICISNVLDVLCKAGWVIQPKPQVGETRRQAIKRGEGDEIILKLTRFLQKPDREHMWDEWLRPFCYDMLVIDAPSMLIRKTFSGELAELVVLRGESIVRYIDENGLTPMAPQPAYAQNWWGLPLVNLSTDQLIYKPRNIMPGNSISSQLYGCSPVEQLAPELELGIARLAFVLSYYTEGSIPGMLQIVPKGTPADKIAEAMVNMNSELAGNAARRWQLRMIQGFADQTKGEKDQIEFTKVPLLSDALDDQHTRRVTFGIGTSPQRLLKSMNRASAEQADDAAETEGTLPYFNWLKSSVMDYLIQYKLGYIDYEWVPDPFTEPSFEKMAAAANEIMSKPVFVPNEMREKFSLDPRSEPEMNMPGMPTGSGWVPIGLATATAGAEIDGSGKITVKEKPNDTKPGASGAADESDTAAGDKPKGGKANGAAATGKAVRRVNGHESTHSTAYGFIGGTSTAEVDEIVVGSYAKASAHDTRRAVIHPGRALPQSVVARHHVEKVLTNQFKTMRRKASKILAKALGKTAGVELAKRGDEEDTASEIERAIRENWRTIADDTWQDFESAALAGAAQGSLQLELDNARVISKINKQASAWAEKRAAELVGMRRTEAGRLVTNPNAEWAITDTTRDKLRRVISDVFETEGANLTTVEDAIRRAGIFDDARATMIARTEISRAQAHSNLLAWRESGEVTQVGWQLSADHDHDDICNDNADNSPYAIGELPEFPAHPLCLCALVLETLKGEEEG